MAGFRGLRNAEIVARYYQAVGVLRKHTLARSKGDDQYQPRDFSQMYQAKELVPFMKKKHENAGAEAEDELIAQFGDEQNIILH